MISDTPTSPIPQQLNSKAMIKRIIACSLTFSVFSLFATAEEASQAEPVPVATVSKDSDASPENRKPKGKTVYLSVDGMG